MGKSGDLLRQQRRRQATYTFTGEQLDAHDRIVAREAFRRREAAMLEKVQAEWDERDRRFKDGGFDETVMSIIDLALAVSLRVLVRDFRWPVSRSGGDGRYRLNRFAVSVVEEFNSISRDTLTDIRQYASEVFGQCHIEFSSEAGDAS